MHHNGNLPNHELRLLQCHELHQFLARILLRFPTSADRFFGRRPSGCRDGPRRPRAFEFLADRPLQASREVLKVAAQRFASTVDVSATQRSDDLQVPMHDALDSVACVIVENLAKAIEENL